MKKLILSFVLIFAVSLSVCTTDNNSNNTAVNLPEVLKTQTVPSNSQSETQSQLVKEEAVAENHESIASTPMPLDFATVFNNEYEDALSARNQLVIGTLKLADYGVAITPEQSQMLLPLWQAVLALESNLNTAPQELSAVQNQILATMTEEQIQTIISMSLTNQDLINLYTDLGITINENPEGTTMGSGQGRGTGGGGGDPTAREATKAAAESLGTPVAERGSQGQNNKNQLTQTVIDYLKSFIN